MPARPAYEGRLPLARLDVANKHGNAAFLDGTRVCEACYEDNVTNFRYRHYIYLDGDGILDVAAIMKAARKARSCVLFLEDSTVILVRSWVSRPRTRILVCKADGFTRKSGSVDKPHTSRLINARHLNPLTKNPYD